MFGFGKKKEEEVDPNIKLGPDGKPLPVVPLTATEQVQLEIEKAASEAKIHTDPFFFEI
jgi:hypothetical protein